MFNVYVACSPAQAAAAPAVMPDQSAMLAAQYGRYAGHGNTQEQYTSSQLVHSPRVVCEPLRSDIEVRAASLFRKKRVKIKALFLLVNLPCSNSFITVCLI